MVDNQKQGWLEARATQLVARIGEHGMVLSQHAAMTLLRERHATVSSQLGISERSARHLLDDAAIGTLAKEIVATFTDEEPGENLFDLPRTAHISVASFGRLISGLAETLLFFQNHPTAIASERDARLRETAQLLSLAGMVQAEHAQGPVAAPPALLTRIARMLTTAAELTDNEALSHTLRRDGIRARSAGSSITPPPAPDA